MNQENLMNIVIKEVKKFNKKTLLSKTKMPENESICIVCETRQFCIAFTGGKLHLADVLGF